MRRLESHVLALLFLVFGLVISSTVVRAENLGPFGVAVLEEIKARALALSEDGLLAFVAGESALWVVNVSQPGAPEVALSLGLGVELRDVWVEGDAVYFLTATGDLEIYRLDRLRGILVRSGSLSLEGEPQAVQVAGAYAYVACGQGGLKVVDVSDPGSPVVEASVPLPDARDLWVDGDHLYVADAARGLVIFRLAPPEGPVEVGTVPGLDRAYGVHVASGYAGVIGAGAVLLFDLSDRESPRELGRLEVSGARAVRLSGEFLYVAAGAAGLRILEFTGDEGLKEVSWLETREASDVCVRGSYAYVADGDGGFRVVDVSQPRAGYEELSGLRTRGYARDLAVQSGQIYVADGDAGLTVIEAADPGAMTLGESFPAQGRANGVFVSGSRVYLAYGYTILNVSRGGLEVFPLPSGEPSSVEITGYGRGVFVAGDYAYLAAGTGGLYILDVSQPQPQSLRRLDTPGQAYAVWVEGDYAYLADYDGGLRIYRVAEPERAHLEETLELEGRALDVCVSGGYLYVASGEAGLFVLEARSPWSILGHVDTEGYAQGVSVVGGYAYVADGPGGVKVVDVSDPWGPRIIGELPVRDACAVQAEGGLVYVAAGRDGVRVFDLLSTPEVPTNPKVDVKVNFQDGPLVLRTYDMIFITLSFDPGGRTGAGDYFLSATLPGGETYWFVSGAWRPSETPLVAYTGPLVPLDDWTSEGLTVLCRDLPPGRYELQFTVDLLPNGALDPVVGFPDSVTFTIEE